MQTLRGGLGICCGWLFSALTLLAQPQFTKAYSGTGDLWGVISGPAGLIAVGTGGAILQSLDGWNWKTDNSGTTEWLLSAAYGKDHYIVVGDKGLILSSTDGATWNRVGAGVTTQRLNKIVFGKGKFVAVGEAETILTSTDGITWKVANQGGSKWLRGLAYTYDNLWIAGGQSGTFYVSPDGLTWKKDPLTVSIDVEAICENGSWFIFPKTTSERRGAIVFSYAGSGGNVGTISQSVGFAPGATTPSIYDDLHAYEMFRPASMPVELRAIGRILGGDFTAFGDSGVGVKLPGTSSETFLLPVPIGATDLTTYGQSTFLVGSDQTILRTTPPADPIFANISTRGYVRTGEQVLIAGTIVSGTQPIKVLVRALGQTLQDYGVGNTLIDPTIEARDGANNLIEYVEAWSDSSNSADVVEAMRQLGAKPLDPAKRDAALVMTLPPGSYTFTVKSKTNKEGVALVDVFDLTPADADHPSHLLNVSTRGYVGPGEQALIAGLIVNGTQFSFKRVLLRALGSRLAPYGIAKPLANPRLIVHYSNGAEYGSNDNWKNQIGPDTTVMPTAVEMATVMAAYHLTSLEGYENDSAYITVLHPGAYTVEIVSADGGTGTALVEAYELPY